MSRNPEDLFRLSEAEARRLVRLYMEAELEILREIDKAMARGSDLKYLRSMLDNVQAILEDLLEGNRRWCEQAIPRVYIEGAKFADKMAGKAIAGFGAVHQQAVKVLADNAFDRLENVRQVIGRRVEDVYRQYALEVTRQSIIGYKTWKQVSQEYRDRLRAEGVTGFRDKRGREWNMKTYAEMVARTTTAQAHWEGTSNRLLEHGIDLVVISSHAGSCEKCAPWQGKVVSLTGKTPGYPTMQQAIDAGFRHPNCRHAFSAYINLDAEIEALEKELGEERVGVSQSRTTDSSSGRPKDGVPALSASVPASGVPDAAKPGIHRAIRKSLEHGLKTGREHLFTLKLADGSEAHAEVEGTAERAEFPNTLMNLLRSAEQRSLVMVHNHSNNTTFSEDDFVKLAEFSSLNAMLVVGHDGTQYYIGKTDRTPNLRASRLRADYQKYLLMHAHEYMRKVKEGAMSKDEAWAAHSEAALRDLAKAYKLEYMKWGKP